MSLTINDLEARMFERREILTSGAVFLAAGTATGAGANESLTTRKSMPMSMNECIELCAASHVMCLETANYVATSIRSAASVALISLLNDCAEICQTTSNSMVRKSALHTTLCRACAEACEKCARECERQSGDQHMIHCAATCRRCAASCSQMAAMGD